MAEHYTHNTVEVSAWCKRCYQNTQHRVSGGKLQFCIPCFKRSEEVSVAVKAAAAAQPKQGRLW